MSRARSSQFVQVTKHDTSCAALRGGDCDCQPETSKVKYVRVCAACGGELKNRRRPYCSGSCRQDARVGAKTAEQRQFNEDVRKARAAEP